MTPERKQELIEQIENEWDEAVEFDGPIGRLVRSGLVSFADNLDYFDEEYQLELMLELIREYITEKN